MNIEWIRSNLKEAIEELERIIEDPNLAEEPSVAFAHAYYHLNAAYNGATGKDPYDYDAEVHDFELRYFPTNLPDVYGKWVRVAK